MATPLIPQPEPPPGVPQPISPHPKQPPKLPDASSRMPLPLTAPLGALYPVSRDKGLKAAPANEEIRKANAATQSVAQKTLMPFDENDTTDIKIEKLSKLINSMIGDPGKNWPYRLERGRLAYYRKEYDFAIADFNQVVNYSKTPETYNWQALTSWKRGDWAKAFEAIEKREEAKEASGQLEPVQPEEYNPPEFQAFSEILRSDPAFAKDWKATRPEMRTTLMRGYEELLKFQKMDLQLKGGLYRYLKGGVHRLTRLHDTLGLVTRNDLEKLWVQIQSTVPSMLPKDMQKTDRLLNRILDFVISAEEEDRPEILKKCIQIVSESVKSVSIDSMTKAFAVMKRTYKSAPKLVLETLNTTATDAGRKRFKELAENENRDIFGAKIYELKEPFGAWDVILRTLLTADRVAAVSLEFPSSDLLSAGNLEKFNTICKIASKLGDEATAQVINKHFATVSNYFIQADVIEGDSVDNLKKILEAERKWGLDLLPMFIMKPFMMYSFTGNEDLYRQYSSVWKQSQMPFLFETRFRDLAKLKEVFNLAGDYPKTLKWLLEAENIFDNKAPPSDASIFYQKLQKFLQEPDFREGFKHAILNIAEKNNVTFLLAMCYIAEPKLRNRFLDLAASVDIQLCCDLLNISRSPFARTEPLNQRLLANTNSLTAPTAKALLQLKKLTIRLSQWWKNSRSINLSASFCLPSWPFKHREMMRSLPLCFQL